MGDIDELLNWVREVESQIREADRGGGGGGTSGKYSLIMLVCVT